MLRILYILVSVYLSSHAAGLALITSNDEVYNTDEQFSAGFEIRYCHNPQWAFHTGLDIYTPRNKKTAKPIAGERPYNSWMYLGASYQHEINILPILFTFVLDLGVRGPKAKGAELQNGAHKFFDANKVHGWASETEHEYGVLWTTVMEYNLLAPFKNSLKRHIQFSVFGRAQAGTILENYSTGMALNLGNHLSKYHTIHVTPRKNAIYLFGMIQTVHVNKNRFLDGNSVYNVIKNKHLKRYDIGINFDYHSYRLRLMSTTTSKEYTTQTELHRYATLELGFTF